MHQGQYRAAADKSLARSDWPKKKQLKGRHFSSDAEVIAAAESWLDGQPSDFFFFPSGLQKLEFGRCSFFLPCRAKDLSAAQNMRQFTDKVPKSQTQNIHLTIKSFCLWS